MHHPYWLLAVVCAVLLCTSLATLTVGGTYWVRAKREDWLWIRDGRRRDQAAAQQDGNRIGADR